MNFFRFAYYVYEPKCVRKASQGLNQFVKYISCFQGKRSFLPIIGELARKLLYTYMMYER